MLNGFTIIRVDVEKIMEKIIFLSYENDTFGFFDQLLDGNIESMLSDYRLFSHDDGGVLRHIRESITPDELLMFMDSSIKMDYNVNAGIQGSAETYRSNVSLSMGQNAVALLLLVLNAAHNLGDNRPLIMDQPEDDLDNSYIYSTLVEEFRKSKQKRQLLISTHDANIPVAADAENVLVLMYNGKHGYLVENGSIDAPNVASHVIDILEGGKEAIKRRSHKYGLVDPEL